MVLITVDPKHLRVSAAFPLGDEESTLAERMSCCQSCLALLPSLPKLAKQTSKACSSLPESPCNLVEPTLHQHRGAPQHCSAKPAVCRQRPAGTVFLPYSFQSSVLLAVYVVTHPHVLNHVA